MDVDGGGCMVHAAEGRGHGVRRAGVSPRATPTGSAAFGIGTVAILRSGARFDLLDPRGARFEVEDVAHGLAFCCRYASQCDGFYSLAEHSLLVADVCVEAPLAALMREAARAFIGDATAVLSTAMPGHGEFERRIRGAIFERLGLPTAIPDRVERARLGVLAAEQEQLMPPGAADWARDAGVHPAAVRVRRLPPFRIKREFLDRYEALRRGSRGIFDRPSPEPVHSTTCTIAR